MTTHRLFGPILLIITTFFYAVSHGLVKHLTGDMHVTQLAFVRFISGPLVLVPFWMMGRFKIRITRWKPMLIRTSFGVSTMLLYFLALKLGEAGRVSLIFQASAIWAMIFGKILFDETPSLQTRWAVPVAFIGLFFVINPSMHFKISLSDTIAIVASLLNAIVFLSLKDLRRDHDTLSIIAVSYSLSALFLVIPMMIYFTPIATTTQWGLLILIGGIGFLGNFLMTVGFKYTATGVSGLILVGLVPMMYAIGIAFFGESPTLDSLFGAAIVIAALGVIAKYQ
ncbi:MAG: DMT family transporter [bacterium]|nr:DMT family transporter [bacterium]